MTVNTLSIAEPFFTVKVLRKEAEYRVGNACILVNVSERPIRIEKQQLPELESRIVMNTTICDVDMAVVVERFADYPDSEALFAEVTKKWPLAYEVRREERLKGKLHYLSPKALIENVFLSMYHTAGVPLNVGLHKKHIHHGEVPVKEVHTQIVGFGRMQQCREKDMATLYMEDSMAPGVTHHIMYDGDSSYPWHQYETTTPGIVMAIEVVPADRVEETPFSKKVERVA